MDVMAKMDTFTVMSPIKSEASGNAGYWLGLLLFFLFFFYSELKNELQNWQIE